MTNYLAIYPNDHLTGATVGMELARRLAGRDDASSGPPVPYSCTWVVSHWDIRPWPQM
jgi:hypothetical protein